MDILHNCSLIHLPVTDSTSNEARRRVEAGRGRLPLVVRADRQTAGRGRGSHLWWSDGGSLTFTIALDPAALGLRFEHEPRVALAAAVAMIEVVAPLLPPGPAAGLGIRWPNDVEVNGRKLAGILPERVESPEGPRLLVGIGLNEATRLDNAPPEVRRMATSLADLRGEPPTPSETEALFSALLERFGATLTLLARDDSALADRWARLDALAGHPVRIDLGPRVVVGVAQGIDPLGGLRVLSDGQPLTLYGGQVLRDPPPL